MKKFKLYMIETLYHVVEIEAKNEQQVKKIFNDNKIDWASSELYDGETNIDYIEEVGF